MMTFLPVGFLAILYAILPTIAAEHLDTFSNSPFTLLDELRGFVPPCAQQCFVSFLEANYPPTTCTTTPGLQCLCTSSSLSGYTVGEGAVQCIISEDDIGFCTGADAAQNVAARAYNMCGALENAIPNTHATLTATLILATSNPSIVLVPTLSAAVASSSTVVPPSSIATSTSLARQSTITSGTQTLASVTSMASSSTSVSAATTASQSTMIAPATAGGLSPPQVAGIVGGCAGAIACLLVGIIILLCLRRRKDRNNDSDSDILPFQKDPGPVGANDPKTSTDMTTTWIPPVPFRIATEPNMFARSSTEADGIGIAISPESRRAPQLDTPDLGAPWKQESRLLPEKPTLKLQLPHESLQPRFPHPKFSLPILNSSQALPVNHQRDSVLTQFDEDAVEPPLDNANHPFQQTVRNPPEKVRKQLRSPDTDARTGLGVPSNSPTPVVRPLNIRKSQQFRPYQVHSATYTPNIEPPIETKQSIHTNQAPQIRVPTGPQQQSRCVAYRPEGTSKPARSRSPDRPDRPEQERQDSQESATSIESQEAVDYPNQRTPIHGPSSVTKSPCAGRSPVTYPSLGDRNPSSSGRVIYPPPQPDFFRSTRPHTQRVLQHASNHSSSALFDDQPWRRAELEQARARARFQASQGQRQYRGSRAMQNTMTSQRPTVRFPINPSQHAAHQHHAYQYSTHQHPQPREPVPQYMYQYQQQAFSPNLRASHAYHGYIHEPPRAAHLRTDSAHSEYSESSSLAARRARPTPALRLHQQQQQGQTARRQSGIVGAPVTPRQLRSRQAEYTGRDDGPFSPGMNLTPRAVGSDLFLVVQ